MCRRHECAAVIPCLDEAPRISEVVRQVRRHVNLVIVVDDGSRDDTANLAANAGASVIRRPFNGGKGSAARLGWDLARKLGFQWVLCMDGDGQHAADDIPALFECARLSNAMLVVGNRMAKPDGMPALRFWVNLWMSAGLSRLGRQVFPDSQCGFRLVHLPSLMQASLRSRHFEVESEMLLAFARLGLPISFVPIQTLYRGSPSKINPVVDTWRWIRWRLAQMAFFGLEA